MISTPGFRHVCGLVLLGFTACSDPLPTAAPPSNEPAPVPTLPSVATFAGIYVREDTQGYSQLELHLGGTFGLRLVLKPGSFEYNGRFSAVPDGLDFVFEHPSGLWTAKGVYSPTGIQVIYNDYMAVDGFSTGFYRLVPPSN